MKRQLTLLPLEDRIVPNGSLPQLIGLQLRDDTGSSSVDRITWDPAVIGTVTNDGDGSLFGVGVEVDIDEDGVVDDRIYPDSAGSILYDRRPSEVGDQVYNFRTFEWNASAGEYLYGPWLNPEFEFEYTHPPISLPVISELALARDTGMPSDGVTFDPTLRGTVTDPDGTAGLRIEYDLNADDIADGITTATASGQFTLLPQTTGGAMSVRVRAREWDASREEYFNGSWSNPVNYSVVAPATAQVNSLVLVRDTGTVGDNVTVDPRVRATLDAADAYNVAFDWTGDGVPDEYVPTNLQGEVVFQPSNLGFGNVTIQARYEEWDYTTNSAVIGSWQSLSFQLNSAGVPSIGEFKLLDDDGTSSNDNVTTDPTVTGVVHYDFGVAGITVEFDHDGDGLADDFATTDGLGRFEFEPLDLNAGSITIKARPVVWDPLQATQVLGNWSQYTFTLIKPVVVPPTVDGFALKNDTGTPGDGITTNPTVTGTLIRPDGLVDGLLVEFDFDGDQIVDATATAASDGTFEHRPLGLSNGAHTLYARGTVWDPNKGQFATSDWSKVDFTLEAATNSPAIVAELKLKTDTGTPGDGQTEDPTLVGFRH